MWSLLNISYKFMRVLPMTVYLGINRDRFIKMDSVIPSSDNDMDMIVDI